MGDSSIAHRGERFDFEEWFELPNYAALDKVRDSKAFDDLFKAIFQIVDVPGAKTYLYRSITEIKRYEPLR